MMIADELRSSGFRVIETANADEALAVLRSATLVDVVLTDIRMPGSMDGLALAELARSTWPRLKVVVASGQSEWRFHIAADDFFLKPYHPERVVQRIRHLLTDRQA